MSKPQRESVPVLGRPLIGATAYEVVAQVLDSNPTIDSLSFVTYREGPNWRDLLHPAEGDDLPLLLRGVHQDPGERIPTKLSRDVISGEKLSALAQGLPGDRLLGVLSKVSLAGGSSGHIPMMDFICTTSTKNLDVLTCLLREIGQESGWLLQSGRSYHYYGVELLTEEEWKVFLGRCLLMSGYVDDRYIGHQLVDGHCVLRISAGQLKATVPRVVAQL